MPTAVSDSLLRYGECIRIGDIEVAVHIVPRRNAWRGVVRGAKGVPGVLPDSAGIYKSHWREHVAAVFIEDHILAYRGPDDFQADAQRFKRRGVRTIANSLHSRGKIGR